MSASVGLLLLLQPQHCWYCQQPLAPE